MNEPIEAALSANAARIEDAHDARQPKGEG